MQGTQSTDLWIAEYFKFLYGLYSETLRTLGRTLGRPPSPTEIFSSEEELHL